MSEWEKFQQLSLWKLVGEIHLWTYTTPTRSMCGWHFNAKQDACDSLCILIEMMMEMGINCKKTIPITWLSNLIVNPGHEWESPLKFTLEYLFDVVDGNYWDFELIDDQLKLSLGIESIKALKAAVQNLPNWKDDCIFSIIRGKGYFQEAPRFNSLARSVITEANDGILNSPLILSRM